MNLFSPFLAYNAIGWVIGGISMIVFAIQIWRIDSSLSTQLTRHYIRYALALGAGLIIFSLPALLTDNVTVLKGAYIIGEGIIDISLIYQAWIAAHFLLGSEFAKRAATSITAALAAFLWFMQALGPDPYRDGQSVVWGMNTPAHIAITAIMTILLLPVTAFFFRQALAGPDLPAKIKAFSTGLTCLIVYLGYMVLLFYYHDRQPLALSVLNIIMFSTFLFALLIPRKDSKKVMASQLGLKTASTEG